MSIMMLMCTVFFQSDFPGDSIEVLMEQNNIPGLTACAFYGDSLIWNGSFGVKNFSYTDSLVNDSTLFYLWSISKTITSISFMQLWEQGIVDLDADIGDYLPYTIRNPLYPVTPITPRMIMTHTSSLSTHSTYRDEELEAGDSTYSNVEFCEEFYMPGGDFYEEDLAFHNFAPGTQFAYNSTYSHGVIAAIVEEQSLFSDSFDLNCREYIFYPLGMEKTSYLITSVDTMNVAPPYAYSGGVFTAPYGYASAPWYATALLKSSSLELSNPFIALLQGGEAGSVRILQEATVDTMMKVQFPTLNDEQCLGLRNIQDFYGRNVWGHYGNIPGTGSSLGKTAAFYCPYENSVVVIAVQYGPETAIIGIMGLLFDFVASEVGIEAEDGAHEIRLTVSPNPCASSASLSFFLPDQEMVTIEVYDLTGRIVEQIFTGSSGPGDRTFELNNLHYASGIYIVRLNAGNLSASERFLIVR